MTWLQATILGVIQGITEFLPVSSDGHLAVGYMLLSLRQISPSQQIFVEVMLHFGTLAAILLYYRSEIGQGVRGLLGRDTLPTGYDRRSLVRTGALVFVALLPLIPDKLFFMKQMEEACQNPIAVGLGFWVTAAALLVTLRFSGGTKGPRETTVLDAILIGVAQALAPLPGVSRSGMTIATALLLGLSREWAVGFSFLIGAPAILGAVVFKLKDAHVSHDQIGPIVFATVLSGVIGYFAIIWLVRVVQRGWIGWFSIYVIILGALVLAFGKTIPEDEPSLPRETTTEISRRGLDEGTAFAIPIIEGRDDWAQYASRS